MPSFDVVSKINLAELDNALNQTKKEIQTRFDFQGTQTEVSLADERTAIFLKSSSEGRLQAAYDVLQSKLVKRGVSLRCPGPEEIEQTVARRGQADHPAAAGHQLEKAKELVKVMKESKMKVQGSIQGDQLRVTGKNKDDLQAAIKLLPRTDGQSEAGLAVRELPGLRRHGPDGIPPRAFVRARRAGGGAPGQAVPVLKAVPKVDGDLSDLRGALELPPVSSGTTALKAQVGVQREQPLLRPHHRRRPGRPRRPPGRLALLPRCGPGRARLRLPDRL